MAMITLAPTAVNSAAQMWWTILNHLVTSGCAAWAGSGDGTSQVSSGGNVFSNTYNSGANGLANARSYAQLHFGDGMELLVIFTGWGTNAASAMSRISPATTFNTGSPTFNVPRSAGDSTQWYGSGSDAAPSGVATISSTGDMRSNRIIGRADNAAPYGFWFASLGCAGGWVPFIFYRDPLVATAVGDTDNYVWSLSGSGSNPKGTAITASLADITSGDVCWAKLSGTYARVSPLVPSYNTSTSMVGGYGSNDADGRIPVDPLRYGRSSSLTAPTGRKGLSTLLGWKLTSTAYSGVQGSRSGGNDQIVMGDLVAEWDGSYVSV